MSNPFFDHPILNSPYDYPRRHWELDEAGQPTQKIVKDRRGAKFITPIPKPKKRKAAAQTGFVFDEGKGLSTKEQQYDPTSIINEVRGYVDTWRALPNPSQWQVTPENSDTSRPFDKPKRGRIAVKVINHLGDEVMKVFRI
jgi:type III restriction enzyme